MKINIKTKMKLKIVICSERALDSNIRLKIKSRRLFNVIQVKEVKSHAIGKA